MNEGFAFLLIIVALIIQGLLLYLLWRFVLAHENIAKSISSLMVKAFSNRKEEQGDAARSFLDAMSGAPKQQP